MLNIEIAINVSWAGSILLTWLTLSQESARTATVSSALQRGKAVMLTCLQAHAQATAAGLSSMEVKVDSNLIVLQVSPLGAMDGGDAEVILVLCERYGRRNN